MTFRSSLKMLRHRLAELRQQAWRDGDAEVARALTVALNGHALDLDYLNRGTGARKSTYFDGTGGAWGEWRASWRSVTYPLRPEPQPPMFFEEDEHGHRSPINVAELMLQREKWESGGRAIRWSGRDDAVAHDGKSGGFTARGEVLSTYHQSAGELKAHDLGNPAAADLLGAAGIKAGHIASDLAGGDHDLVWLRYGEHCRPDGYDLEHHRDVMSRGGRLPAELRFAKADAERIIVAMHDDGISDTAIGRVFTVNRKTIARVLERRPNVPVIPYRGKEFVVVDLATPTVLAHLDAQDETLQRIERALAAIQAQLFATTGKSQLAYDVVRGLIVSARISEAA